MSTSSGMRRFRLTRTQSPGTCASDFRASIVSTAACLAAALLFAGSALHAPAHAQGLLDENGVEELFEQHQEMLRDELLEDHLVEPQAQAPDPARRDRQLDRLFERLAKAEDENEARGVSLLIHRRWMRSGSATADLLMVRAQQAIRADDHALAIELLDRVLVLEPDWAEAWNRRAVTFHMLGDPVAAMADIHRVLTLEPRHFGAWAGLGHIFREGGDDTGALASYERALEINPHIPRLPPIVEKLRRDIEGLDL
jgi:tetratricopeptide (TPR) repeat protein